MAKFMKKKTILTIIILIYLTLVIAFNFEYYSNVVKSKIIRDAVDNSPGKAPENTYPLILLHGFNPTYSRGTSGVTLKNLQDELSKDLDYVNKGILTDESHCGELKYSKNPIIIRVTYFENFKLLTIDEYSRNIQNSISKIKYCTGAEKVDIIGNSMGGVVARNYIKKLDDSSVRRMIFLGTPNHGGVYNVGEIANLLAGGESRINLDFIELSGDSKFMTELNKGDETPGDVEYYSIAGDIDGKGDGLVLAESVFVDGDTDKITVECNHLVLGFPKLCPKAYEFIKKSLTRTS
ncbi:hypothetical protein CL622_06370 [archaeon]|nr:hypothetical protein [archaeon]